jgi:hypothetical protein
MSATRSTGWPLEEAVRYAIRTDHEAAQRLLTIIESELPGGVYVVLDSELGVFGTLRELEHARREEILSAEVGR